jgi:hypothetical protein
VPTVGYLKRDSDVSAEFIAVEERTFAPNGVTTLVHQFTNSRFAVMRDGALIERVSPQHGRRFPFAAIRRP